MNRTNLTDVTFLIPVRIDSEERFENLNLVLEFLKANFKTTIKVLEADAFPYFNNDNVDYKTFVVDDNPIFHRTKYLNQLTKSSTTPYLAIWDTDVILEPQQIVNSVELLRKQEAEMVFPYDGNFYKIPQMIKSIYRDKTDITVFSDNRSKFLRMFGHFSVGGAFIVNRQAYMEAGMENEKFYGWGPEDIERVKRWEILGYRIRFIDGPLFHLYHKRKLNSWHASRDIELENRLELLKICGMNKVNLRNYIKTINV